MHTKRLIRISILTSILSVLSLVTIPVGPVPITLSTLGVFLCGYILGGIDGTISVLIYILLGLIGIPVFAGGKSGIGVVLGPTGGYLLSFIPASFISGYFVNRYNKLPVLLISGVLCILIMYIIGVPYLSLVTGMPILKALKVGAYPFIIPDIIKMVISVVLSLRIRRRLIKENLM